MLDSSVVIDWLLRRPHAAAVDTILETGHPSLHVPQLLFMEVTQVLRRLASAGDITAGRGAQALADLSDAPMASYPHEPFLPRIWQLRANVSAYDGVYLALAETLAAPFMTLDRRLAKAGRVHATCEVIEP